MAAHRIASLLKASPEGERVHPSQKWPSTFDCVDFLRSTTDDEVVGAQDPLVGHGKCWMPIFLLAGKLFDPLSQLLSLFRRKVSFASPYEVCGIHDALSS